VGYCMLAVAVGSLQTILEKGESEDWFAKPYILVLTISAVLGHIVYMARDEYRLPDSKFQPYPAPKFCGGDVHLLYIRVWFVWLGVCVPGILPEFAWALTPSKPASCLFPGGLCTIVMMPFIGKMLNKGIPAQFMATAGMFLFFVFTIC
jgi:DHA2 family multidrug resistance protein